MKVLRIILVLIGLLILLVIGVGLFGPTSMDVSYTQKLNAPVASVFNQVEDFKNWPNWSPWAESDPEMKVTYGDKSKGEGASYSWEGPVTGKGRMDMREVVKSEKLGMDIGFDMGNGLEFSTADMFFKQEGEATEVTWNFNSTGSDGFMERIMNVVMPSKLEGMYQQGLTKLEKVALENPYTPEEEPVLNTGVKKEMREGFFYLGERYENVGLTEISSAMYAASYGKIMSYMGENNAMDKLVQPPISVTEKYDEESQVTTFSVAMMTSEKIDAGSGLESRYMNDHSAMVMTHYGPYETIADTYEKLMTVIMAKEMEPLFPCYEIYVTDPETEPDSTKWETKVVIPTEWASEEN